MRTLTLRPNPANVGGPRPASAIRMILLHCTDGDTAEGAGRWWARPTVEDGTEGSAHVAFDDQVMVRAVDDTQVAYGARGYNQQGLHIEIAGKAAWDRTTWLRHRPRLAAAAAFQANAHRVYAVPFTESTTHGWHSHAGLPGNDHTDPGPGFPYDVYLEMVRKALANPTAGVTKPWPPPYGATLRLFVPGHSKPWAGWGECIGPMLNIARHGLDENGAHAWITWRGHTWRGARQVEGVIRRILAQHVEA